MNDIVGELFVRLWDSVTTTMIIEKICALSSIEWESNANEWMLQSTLNMSSARNSWMKLMLWGKFNLTIYEIYKLSKFNRQYFLSTFPANKHFVTMVDIWNSAFIHEWRKTLLERSKNFLTHETDISSHSQSEGVCEGVLAYFFARGFTRNFLTRVVALAHTEFHLQRRRFSHITRTSSFDSNSSQSINYLSWRQPVYFFVLTETIFGTQDI